MVTRKTPFVLFFGNRGFFPSSLLKGAREDLPMVLHRLGHDALVLEERETNHGAVETVREGERFARFLRENRGKFGGVVLCLPNFGDETGAVAALKEAGVPIFIQAYPDDLSRMSPTERRDSFCGKLSIMDVFCQYGIKFTVQKPHVVIPSSPRFAENIDYFDRVCRVANGVKGMVVGAIGARTTPFKTVRFDEVALQRHGITVETLDLSDVMNRMHALSFTDALCRDKAEVLKAYSSWEGVPDKAFETLVKLGVVLDRIIDEYKMDAIALRCWTELQTQLGISPCVIMSELNDRGIASACEVDVGNAVAMRALGLASDGVATCLDWNNNYGDDDDKCILFHCGPVPNSLMQARGRITEQEIFVQTMGKGCSFGCNVGRVKNGPFTFGSMLTDSGEVRFYLGEGDIKDEPIPEEFFGCAGVAEIKGLQEVLLHVGRNGFRHHVILARGRVREPLQEALTNYLGCSVSIPQHSPNDRDHTGR
jgi:L-fucose isomerase-like protein